MGNIFIKNLVQKYDTYTVIDDLNEVINDGELCDLAAEVARSRGLEVIEPEKSLGGEDFSLFLTERPGAFLRIGTGGNFPIHHPRFTADPKALEPTAEFFADLAIESLKR